jgi:hypothetical protein
MKDDLATFGYAPKGWSNESLGLRWLKENFEPDSKKVLVFRIL